MTDGQQPDDRGRKSSGGLVERGLGEPDWRRRQSCAPSCRPRMHATAGLSLMSSVISSQMNTASVMNTRTAGTSRQAAHPARAGWAPAAVRPTRLIGRTKVHLLLEGSCAHCRVECGAASGGTQGHPGGCHTGVCPPGVCGVDHPRHRARSRFEYRVDLSSLRHEGRAVFRSARPGRRLPRHARGGQP